MFCRIGSISPFDRLLTTSIQDIPIRGTHALFRDFQKSQAKKLSRIHISWNWKSYHSTDGRKPIIKDRNVDHFYFLLLLFLAS